MHAYVCTLHAYIYTHIYIHIYVYAYIFIYIYTYLHVYAQHTPMMFHTERCDARRVVNSASDRTVRACARSWGAERVTTC